MRAVHSVIAIAGILGAAAIASAANDPGLSIFKPGEHCVAYKTRKRLMLIRSVDVIGRSCRVSSQVLPDLGGLYYFEMNVPIESFQSGESERDRDVLKILAADRQPELLFRSQRKKPEEWRELLAKGEDFEVAGELVIGRKSYPVKAVVRLVNGPQGPEVDGRIKTQFKDLGIDPPSLIAGLMAKVSSEVELHFHFLADKTLGSENILPSAK